MRNRTIVFIAIAGFGLAALGGLLAWRRDDLFEKRVRIIEPHALVRGAWQRPIPLARLIEREKIHTIVSLSAINTDDPKYVDQKNVLEGKPVRWLIVPMRGSKASPEQMAEAADLLADQALRPIFFHCVAGHHRTGLTLAAYRIRHQGWSVEKAWNEWLAQPWARQSLDIEDRRQIEAFAARQSRIARGGNRETIDASEANSSLARPGRGDSGDPASRSRPLAMGGR